MRMSCPDIVTPGDFGHWVNQQRLYYRQAYPASVTNLTDSAKECKDHPSQVYESLNTAVGDVNDIDLTDTHRALKANAITLP